MEHSHAPPSIIVHKHKQNYVVNGNNLHTHAYITHKSTHGVTS